MTTVADVLEVGEKCFEEELRLGALLSCQIALH
jgi:hypothetical protein